MSQTISIRSDQVICTEFDGGEAILVDLRTKRYYQLNETALIIWKGLEKGQTVPEIVDTIVAGYEVIPEYANDRVRDLIRQLESYRLIGN